MAVPYDLTDRIGTRATLGLVVLQTDETLEQDFRRIFTATDVALYVSRVPSAADVTPQTLADMAVELPRAAALLPPALEYDVIGYGCTSGATVIGPGKVGDLVRGAARARAVSNPLSAVIAGLNALRATRVGMVTPYIESVTEPMRAALVAAGFSIATCVSFEEAEESKVARIDANSIFRAAVMAAENDAEAIFLSCTNLRTLDIIGDIEAELNIPVISSNQALAWDMARLAGISCDGRFGKLLA